MSIKSSGTQLNGNAGHNTIISSMLKHIEFLKHFKKSSSPESLSRTVQQDNAQGELIQMRMKPIQVRRHLSVSRIKSHLGAMDELLTESSRLYSRSIVQSDFPPWRQEDEVNVTVMRILTVFITFTLQSDCCGQTFGLLIKSYALAVL